MPFSRDLPNPGIKHQYPALKVDTLPSEPPQPVSPGSNLGQGIKITHHPTAHSCLIEINTKGYSGFHHWFYKLHRVCQSQSQSEELRETAHGSASFWQCSDPRLLHPWDFTGKSTGSSCHFLLQGNGKNSYKSHEAGNRLAYWTNIKKSNAFPMYLPSEGDEA